MKKTLMMLVTMITMMFAGNAMADNENAGAWVKMDARVPTVKLGDAPLNLRFTPELAFLDTSGGLATTTARAGLQHSCTPWFSLTLNGVDTSSKGSQDVKLEAQPELTLKANENFTLKNRTRFAVRALDSAAGNRLVAQDEVKIVLTPDNSPVFVWAAYEGFADVSNGNLNQHRVLGGLGRKMSDSTTLSLGYMRRMTKAAPEWVNDNFVYLLADFN